MSAVQFAQDQEVRAHALDAIDRLMPTWDSVPVSRLRVDNLYLFVTPSRRVFATYQGRQNGHLNVKTDRTGTAVTVETETLQGVFKIGGDLTVAEELNKRFTAQL